MGSRITVSRFICNISKALKRKSSVLHLSHSLGTTTNTKPSITSTPIRTPDTIPIRLFVVAERSPIIQTPDFEKPKNQARPPSTNQRGRLCSKKKRFSRQ